MLSTPSYSTFIEKPTQACRSHEHFRCASRLSVQGQLLLLLAALSCSFTPVSAAWLLYGTNLVGPSSQSCSRKMDIVLPNFPPTTKLQLLVKGYTMWPSTRVYFYGANGTQFNITLLMHLQLRMVSPLLVVGDLFL